MLRFLLLVLIPVAVAGLVALGFEYAQAKVPFLKALPVLLKRLLVPTFVMLLLWLIALIAVKANVADMEVTYLALGLGTVLAFVFHLEDRLRKKPVA